MNATKYRRATYRDHPANVQLHKLAERMEQLRCDLLDYLAARKPGAMLRDLHNYGVRLTHHLGGLAVMLELIPADVTVSLPKPTDAAMKQLRKAS